MNTNKIDNTFLIGIVCCILSCFIFFHLADVACHATKIKFPPLEVNLTLLTRHVIFFDWFFLYLRHVETTVLLSLIVFYVISAFVNSCRMLNEFYDVIKQLDRGHLFYIWPFPRKYSEWIFYQTKEITFFPRLRIWISS